MAVESATEQNKAVVTRFVEAVWENGNVDAIDTLFTENSALHAPTEDVRGREAFKTYNERCLAAFPDLQYDIQDLIADDDGVVFRAWMGALKRGSSWASNRPGSVSMRKESSSPVSRTE